MKVDIQKAKKEDIPTLATILVRCWRSAYRDFIPLAFLDSMDLGFQTERHLKYFEKGTRYLVASNADGQVLGFSSYGQNRIRKITAQIELYTLYIDEEFRGMGVGSTLLREVLNSPNCKGKNMGVCVFSKNPYKGFYYRHGFRHQANEIMDMGEFILDTDILLKEMSV